MLTDKEIKAAKPRDKTYKLSDGLGMYLEVKSNGSKLWRLKYRYEGREKRISFGSYPDTLGTLARQKRDEARKQLAAGIDPSAARKAIKDSAANSFELVAREWLALQQKKLAASTFSNTKGILETLIFPYIGSRPIDKISASEVLKPLKLIEARGLHETAHRARQKCSQILRYAVQTERALRDVSSDLRGALASIPTKNYASIKDPIQIGQLLRDIDKYRGNIVTWYALRIAPHVFVRPGELRHAHWLEFDLDSHSPQWRIPAERMKMREQHIVGLSTQATNLFKELKLLTGDSDYVFPAIHTRSRPMSENTINLALRRMGYDNETMTGHGFRSMASTCLNELGWHPDLIELQLSHAERNSVRAAYNKAQRLPERRKMMQAWSDYLDELRDGAKIIPFLQKY